MDDKIYKITLADGTVIDNLKLNGNNFISPVEIDETIFDENCSNVTISDGEKEDIHINMELVQITKMGEEYWFVLRDVSEQEITQRAFMLAASMMATKTLSDEETLSVSVIFPEWSSNSVSYKKDDRVRYGNMLYKCLQEHISQNSWTPDAASSLWVRINDPAIEWPEWIQPTGAHDAYPKGAKVTHKEKKWISDIDSNVWEPGTISSNWTEYSEE